MNLKPTEAVTGKVRLNFPVLFTPNPASQRSLAAREATSRGTRLPNAG